MDNRIKVCPLSMSGDLKQCIQTCVLYSEGKCLLAEALKKTAEKSDKKN